MPTYSQDNMPISVSTPLAKDSFLLEKFSGTENISDLFHFQLDLLVESDTTIAFDQVLGQAVTVTVNPPGATTKRYFNGIVSRMTQGVRVFGPEGDITFIRYQMEVVPKFWLLKRNVQSRTFQQKSVTDILKVVLANLSVSYETQGTYEPRDYCVQYRESDFDFACRLMEEEGIFYFFNHTQSDHQMVLADSAQSNPTIPGDSSTLNFDELGQRKLESKQRILTWMKSQELRSGKETLWDQCFEMFGTNFEAKQSITESVSVGTVTHKLKVGGNDSFEIYDFPGRYAQRFDGVDSSGGDQSSNLQKIFQDNTRTVGIRMDQEAMLSLIINGQSDCRYMTAGNKFTLADHYDANGDYVLLSIDHLASIEGSYFSTEAASLTYSNVFQCLPSAIPYRPPIRVQKARVDGPQTATVVGPSGDEIFTDKYGRVKVQFPWDRTGTNDASSSCWVRVGSMWAGQQWGMVHIPRVGQEVIVAFEEGDADRPIIVGSVYNATNMPPYTLPDNKTQSGIKSRSTLQGDATMSNELRFEDKKQSEDVYFHAQKDFHRVVENDDDLKVNHDQTITIKNNRTETVSEGNESVTITKGNRTLEVSQGNDSVTIDKGNSTLTITEGNESVSIAKGTRTVSVKSDDSLTIEGKRTMTVTNDRSVTVSQGNDSLTVSQGNGTITISQGNLTISVSAGNCSISAMNNIELKVGSNSVAISQSGVTIKGVQVQLQGTATAQMQAPMTTIKADTMLQLQGTINKIG